MTRHKTLQARLQDLAFVALGANLPFGGGDPAHTLRAVLPALQQLSAAPLRVSSFYESDPKDCPPGSPRYVNAVAALLPLPGATPELLLHALQAMEQRFGRVRSGVVNEARTLDLDLIAFRSETRATPFLTLPHPSAHERRFVLQPWIEIAGPGLLLAGKCLDEWELLCTDPPLTKLHDCI
ncbi:MAG: 2-amino-4-hydroxy-6-hydroxymethyldihydropteridine diphosphokinase [Pseudohongiellaceae bacterium]